MTDGGILDTGTGIITYSVLLTAAQYSYTTKSSAIGAGSPPVTVSLQDPPPQTGDNARPALLAALTLLATAGAAFVLLKYRRAHSH